jgi:formylglycine-generating enzyme
VNARARAARVLLTLGLTLACERHTPPETNPTPSANGTARPNVSSTPPPVVLYLPDGGDHALEGAPPPGALASPGGGRCGADMVDVGGRFCIDRYEASLVDVRLARAISPYFAPRRADAQSALDAFVNTTPRSAPELPRPPGWELMEAFEPKALSVPGVTPNGYVSGLLAARACENAGKRLCSAAEWVTACRGERNQQFPYGSSYEPGACNVYREAHPATVLWGNASRNHLDPRLNLVNAATGPLLRRTGETSRCRSDWGPDAVFDMVGNLDEWVDEPGGAFLGGFYARATMNGCDARVTQHPPAFFDYSTGVRCCR